MTVALDQTLTILSRLVGFDTTSRNSNLELIHYVEKLLLDLGLHPRLDYNADRTKANLLVSVGPLTEGGFLLSGHTDVVPTDNQNWDSDPFTLIQKDTRVYGRGTADMKGFLASVLAMLPLFLKAKLRVPIHIVFSYDEEVGCQGIGSLVQYIRSHVPGPSLAILGEPTEMRVIEAHKGITGFTTIVRGAEAHSSCTHKGVNAIEIAARLITFLQETLRAMETTEKDSRFDPSYPTCNMGIIEGGTAVNIVANQCSFRWEIRTMKDKQTDFILSKFRDFSDKVVKEFQQISDQVNITTRQDFIAPPLLETTPADIHNLILRLPHTNAMHCASFATEAGIYQHAGIPAIVCGPGSILQAHKPDEFIEVSQLQHCLEFLENLAKFASGK